MNQTEKFVAVIMKEEYDSIAKLKILLKSKMVEIDQIYFDDYFYLKFLRARKFDLDKTFDMMCGYLKWFFEHDGYNSQVLKNK